MKHIIIIVVLGLSLVNIVLFAKSVILADSISKLETSIQKVSINNKKLEKQLYASNSLERIEKKAGKLGFTKKAAPVYLETLHYAQAH